jgi:hypothetical protein
MLWSVNDQIRSSWRLLSFNSAFLAKAVKHKCCIAALRHSNQSAFVYRKDFCE